VLTTETACLFCKQAHFEECQFEQHRADGKKLLRWNAVPTLFGARRCLSARPRTAKKSDEQLDHGYCRKQRLVAPTVVCSASASGDSTLQTESGSANVSQSAAPPRTAKKSDEQLDHGYCRKQRLVAPTIACSASASGDSTLQTESGSANASQSAAADTQSCCELADLQERVTALQKEVKQAQQQLRLERARHSNLVSGMKSFLNPDQIRWLWLGPKSNRTLHWSNETVESCLDIFHAVGKKGYVHLRNRGFPIPSYRTLCDRVVGAKSRPGIENDVSVSKQPKVNNMSSGSAQFHDCCQPSPDYNKGIDSIFTLIKDDLVVHCE